MLKRNFLKALSAIPLLTVPGLVAALPEAEYEMVGGYDLYNDMAWVRTTVWVDGREWHDFAEFWNTGHFATEKSKTACFRVAEDFVCEHLGIRNQQKWKTAKLWHNV